MKNDIDEELDEDIEETANSGKEQEEAVKDSGEEEDVINIDLLIAENKKLKEDFLRAYADSENTKKRCLQEIEKNNKYAIASFAKNLLGVADNLQRAIDSVNNETASNCETLLKGVELTQEELHKVFAKFGVVKMDIIGKVFDPNFHQVVQQVEDKTKPAGTVIAELQSGYMINDRILREAMVIVTTGGK
ncbi:MAG: nucleotide exchange factor GrpE [Lactobacillaceae bacterium]|jgi:molecular chaperone GrpE|nr:nucleotide exchange factor GrpE [Lactobacillaceae bacterium]